MNMGDDVKDGEVGGPFVLKIGDLRVIVAFSQSEGMNTFDDGVGHGKLCPTAAWDALSCFEGEETIRTL